MAMANTSNIQLVHRHFSGEKCLDPLNQGWRTYLLSRATLSVTAEKAGRTTF